jgi:hypothetical protein
MNGMPQMYRALVWIGNTDGPGQRVSVLAGSLDEAAMKIRTTYGEEAIFRVHHEADAGNGA